MGNANMLKSDLVFKLWDLANLTVVFSVAQAMTFFYMATEKEKLETLLKFAFAQYFTLLVSLAGYGIYLGIIWGCQAGVKNILSEADWNSISQVWSIATICRYSIVTLFMLLSLALYCRLFIWI